MPFYDYECKCGIFQYFCRIGQKPTICEKNKCNPEKMKQVYSVPNAIVEQEPTTLGQLADKNAKTFGFEECLEREMKQKEAYDLAQEKKTGKKKKPKKLPWWRSGEIEGTVRSEKPVSGKLLEKCKKIAKEANVNIETNTKVKEAESGN